MLIFLRSLTFSFVMILSMAIVSILGLLTSFLPFPQRFHIVRSWAVISMWTLENICGIKYNITGQENTPSKPTIIFCKHQSAWETLALQQFFPPQVYVIKRELLWVPFFGWCMAVLTPIAINRKAGRSAIKLLVREGIDRLQKGRWVVIFPEGTRVAAGKKGRYHIGGAILAAKSGVPVLPIAHNAGELWPRRGFFKKPGTIEVVIGPVIPTQGRKADEILADVEEWIESTMHRISNVPYEG